MGFEHRSYSSNLYRPRPEVEVDESNGLTIIATPWGQRSAATKAIDNIKTFLMSTLNDVEVTSPFDKLTCLSPLANNLRTAIMLTNDLIYREENAEEYSSAIELTVILRSHSEAVIAHIGQPWIFVQNNSQTYVVQGQPDLQSQFDGPQKHSFPLPNSLLGLHSTSHFEVRRVHLQRDSKILLLSRSTWGSDFLNVAQAASSIERMSDALIRENSEMPFWIGRLSA